MGLEGRYQVEALLQARFWKNSAWQQSLPVRAGRCMGGVMKEKLLPKVKALYEAVLELIGEDVDIRDVKVSDITGRAGIGKGTAYEYFSNKEELISSALLYHIDLISSQMMESLRKKEGLVSRVCLILECMDREISKRDCLIQFIQLLTDNGPIGKALHKGLREKNEEICTPQDVIGLLIQDGIRQGEIKGQLPDFYMRMVVISKLLVYAIYIMEDEAAKLGDKGQMHRMLCEGLLKELG